MVTDPTALLTEFATTIRDALDLPDAAVNHLDAEQRLRLSRANAVRIAAEMAVLAGEDTDAVARTVEWLRARIDQLPVTYERYIGPAKDHPGDCQVCGPCCSPVLGIHGTCPGPHAGATVVSVR